MALQIITVTYIFSQPPVRYRDVHNHALCISDGSIPVIIIRSRRRFEEAEQSKLVNYATAQCLDWTLARNLPKFVTKPISVYHSNQKVIITAIIEWQKEIYLTLPISVWCTAPLVIHLHIVKGLLFFFFCRTARIVTFIILRVYVCVRKCPVSNQLQLPVLIKCLSCIEISTFYIRFA